MTTKEIIALKPRRFIKPWFNPKRSTPMMIVEDFLLVQHYKTRFEAP
jgi:hypothetical protein